jgi:microcin C transport system substrate-binding protein
MSDLVRRLHVWLAATCIGLGVVAPPASVAFASQAPQPAAQRVTLPPDLVWQTNEDDPLIGSPNAIRGGTLQESIGSYPLTFRLKGPNSNDAFASWNRLFTFEFGLVNMNPVTDRYEPMMATHWAIADDQRTLYFRLDPDARWSDGRPVTAHDFVFTVEMMRSPHIIDPFYNSYAERNYESIEAIDDHTLRIVGMRPSWRPLFDYGGLWPTPRHVHTLDEDWVRRMTNVPQVVPGPYVITEQVRGESIVLTRVPNWWGDGKRRFTGLYNYDRIVLRVMPLERRLDWLRRGELDVMAGVPVRTWNEEFTFPAARNGWIRRARIFVEWPDFLNGLHMNLEAPIFQNKDFRKAMQYLVNFDRINQNLLYGETFRMVSFFGGTEFANPELQPYGFNPSKASEHLAKAGFFRPDELRSRTLWGRFVNIVRGLLFTRTDTDAVLVNERGQRASFTLSYGSKQLEPHLTVLQQEFRRAGVDMRLRLLEPGTNFERGLERKYEMTLTARVTGFYPQPRQYFHTEFQRTTNNNNIWGFSNEEVDRLIEVYETSLDPDERRAAMHRIDAIVQDEAFYIPLWTTPFLRVAHWDYVRFPDTWLPPRTRQFTDHMVSWIDPERRAAVERAMREGTAMPPDDGIDKDPWGIRARRAGSAQP